MRTTAVLDGDEYILNGTKAGSPTPTRRTPSSCSPRRIRLPSTVASPAFLVAKDTPGFSLGKKEDKLGIRASSTAQLFFE